MDVGILRGRVSYFRISNVILFYFKFEGRGEGLSVCCVSFRFFFSFGGSNRGLGVGGEDGERGRVGDV